MKQVAEADTETRRPLKETPHAQRMGGITKNMRYTHSHPSPYLPIPKPTPTRLTRTQLAPPPSAPHFRQTPLLAVPHLQRRTTPPPHTFTSRPTHPPPPHTSAPNLHSPPHTSTRHRTPPHHTPHQPSHTSAASSLLRTALSTVSVLHMRLLHLDLSVRRSCNAEW